MPARQDPGEGLKTVADFTLEQGQSHALALNYRASHLDTLPKLDAPQQLERTEALWKRWSSRCKLHGRWDGAVLRSLITLKALLLAGYIREAQRARARAGVKDAERLGLEAPLERWRGVRNEIHAEVCARGFDASRNSLVQSYESPHLDASLLLIPQVGFLPADDPRMLSTIAAIERELIVDGLVLRYSTESGIDALPMGEGAFLPCSFWLADCYALSGRLADAEALFEHLLSLSNDVGLFAEEYDARSRRMLGNFPQALTHMALVNTARLLSMPAHEAQAARAGGERPAAPQRVAKAAAANGDSAGDAAEDEAIGAKQVSKPSAGPTRE